MTTSVQEGGAVDEVEALLTAEEVAALLRVERSWLYGAARNGQFPCVRVGRYVRFRPDDVKQWIATGGRA